ncbi:hypothetical protein EJ02DRAFT_348815 [Clathrospora elynae]|uniref:F-box domain-containing protein n=1 Tax=Clathrospora elynae TaxID=706981 RepID=A0A6A5SV63_9PLEO|nr:hypothetical protein EJ02DRAFT_348815 [Clathrospora elynae]
MAKASTDQKMKSAGFRDLPSEVRNRIYHLCASDPERLDEQHVSRRGTASTAPTSFEARGYYGLTQANSQTRKEFREMYFRDRTISVHIRDAQDYLETMYTNPSVNRETIAGWLTIRTDVERRGKYNTPIEVRALLRILFNTPGLDYEFTGARGGAIFNELFIGYETEWRYAVENVFKSVELKEPSMFGMRLVVDRKCRLPWVEQCPISVTRLPHMPEESVPFFSELGLDLQNDMIFVRKSAPKWLGGEFKMMYK